MYFLLKKINPYQKRSLRPQRRSRLKGKKELVEISITNVNYVVL
jgi:hypothetical protein